MFIEFSTHVPMIRNGKMQALPYANPDMFMRLHIGQGLNYGFECGILGHKTDFPLVYNTISSLAFEWGQDSVCVSGWKNGLETCAFNIHSLPKSTNDKGLDWSVCHPGILSAENIKAG